MECHAGDIGVLAVELAKFAAFAAWALGLVRDVVGGGGGGVWDDFADGQVTTTDSDEFVFCEGAYFVDFFGVDVTVGGVGVAVVVREICVYTR